MSATSIATTYQTRQGWTDTTLLDLTQTYIDNQQSPDAFVDYLRDVADEDNDEYSQYADEILDLTTMSADQIIEAQGWTDTTLLDLLLTYINRQDDNPVFEDYLRGIAADENGGPTKCFLCGGPVENLGDGDFYCVNDCTAPTDDEEDDAEDTVENTIRSEEVWHVNSVPLRLSFEPSAIREHFDGEYDLDAITDDALARVGWAALTNDRLYNVFHEVLVDALTEVVGDIPETTSGAEGSEEDGEGVLPYTCGNCGNPIDGAGVDSTGSRRCDDLDPAHRYHFDSTESAGHATIKFPN